MIYAFSASSYINFEKRAPHFRPSINTYQGHNILNFANWPRFIPIFERQVLGITFEITSIINHHLWYCTYYDVYIYIYIYIRIYMYIYMYTYKYMMIWYAYAMMRQIQRCIMMWNLWNIYIMWKICVYIYTYIYIHIIDIVCINICFCFVGLRSDSTFPKNFEKVPVSTMASNSPCRILLVYHPHDCDSDLGRGVDWTKNTEVHRGSVVWRVRFPSPPPLFWRNLGERLAGYLEDRDPGLVCG